MSAEPFFARLDTVFAEAAERLNTLDAAIGDGDHGATMSRGLRAAAAAGAGARAKAFMRASGGASGTLFGLILVEIERVLEGEGGSLHDHLARGLDRIRELGQVEPGDKSMVDALAPAVDALGPGGGLGAAVAAAAAGRDATRNLAARRGRARYVENAGQGHVDPGAVSVHLILATLADVSAR